MDDENYAGLDAIPFVILMAAIWHLATWPVFCACAKWLELVRVWLVALS